MHLAQARQKLSEAYGTARTTASMLARMNQWRLEGLLEQLAYQPEEAIPDWASAHLEMIDMYVLVMFYGTVEPRLHSKVRAAFAGCHDEAALWMVWKQFLDQPEVRAVQQFMQTVLEVEEVPPWWQATAPDLLQGVRGAFRSENPLSGLILAWQPRDLVEVFDGLRVDSEDALAHALVVEYFVGPSPLRWKTMLGNSRFDWTRWCALLDDKSRKRAQTVVRSYLLSVPVESLDEHVLRSLIVRWGDPKTPTVVWADVGDEALGRMLEWLRLQQIAEFFEGDNERYQFWKGYLERCQEVQRIEMGSSPAAVVLYFDLIVLVEYANTGNACYRYRRDQFEQVFKKARTTLDLKDSARGVQMVHGGAWQSNFADDLAVYIGYPTKKVPF